MSRTLTHAVLGLGLLACAAGVSAVPIISVDLDPGMVGVQSARTVSTGEAFSLDVVIEDVTDLIGYEIALDFDDVVLDWTSASDGGFLNGSVLVLPPTSGSTGSLGSVVLPAISFGPAATGSGVLASFSFNAALPGASVFPLSVTLTAPGGVAIDPDSPINSARLVVRDVPAPATFVLVATGLLVLLRARRRR